MSVEKVEDAALRGWIDRVEERCRVSGVAEPSRARLRRELESDLAAAWQSGATIGELTSESPSGFADEVLRANDEQAAATEPLGSRDIATTALLGALGGAAVVWFVLWPVLIRLLSSASDVVILAVFYPVVASTVLLGAVAALRLRYGQRAAYREVVVPALVGMCVGFLVGLPATLLVSRALAYPNAPALMILEAVPMMLTAVCGIWLALRLSSIRRRRSRPTAVA